METSSDNTAKHSLLLDVLTDTFPKQPMNKPARTPWRRRPRKYLLATQQVRGRLRQAQQHLDPSLHSAFGDFDKVFINPMPPPSLLHYALSLFLFSKSI